jgi:hypothetical protein
MDRRTFLATAALPVVYPLTGLAQSRRTEVTIRGDAFYINGQPTYRGRAYNGTRIEGLLMNVRAVQGIFDDVNPTTVSRWMYPDTGRWDADRNTDEFVAALAEWRRHGVLAFTINLQRGSPGGQGGRVRGTTPGAATPDVSPSRAGNRRAGASRGPIGSTLENSAIDPDGHLRPAYMARLQRVLDRADELGMVAIVGYFYFGQDQRLEDEVAVRRAVVNATTWLLDHGYRNVIVEVNNECNIGYDHDILKPPRVSELIRLVRSQAREGRRLLVSTSFGGTTSRGDRDNPDTPITSSVVQASDFVLIHGNGPNDPALLRRCIAGTRALAGYRPMPVLVNEDPNFSFAEPNNHLLTAIDDYVSWGYYDPGQNNYRDGYQSPPVNWGINTDTKKQFFELVKTITGG